MVIAARIGFVAKKVNLLEAGALGGVSQRVRFVPAAREHIETDLAANAVRQIDVVELLLQRGNHFRAHPVLNVVGGKEVAFVARALASDGAHVHHAVAKLDERAALEGQLHFGQVAQHIVDESLQRRLSEVQVNRLFAHLDAALDLHEAVLGEYVVEVLEDAFAVELLKHFLQVGAADNADGGQRFDLGVQERLEGGFDVGSGHREGAVHVEQEQHLGAGVSGEGHDGAGWKCVKGIF